MCISGRKDARQREQQGHRQGETAGHVGGSTRLGRKSLQWETGEAAEEEAGSSLRADWP